MAQTLTISQLVPDGLPVRWDGAPRGQGGIKPTVMKLLAIAATGTYATGGVALTAEQIGFGEVVKAIIPPVGGIVFEYDYQNEKIKAFWVDTTVDGAPLAEVPNTTNLGTYTMRALFFGIEPDEES